MNIEPGPDVTAYAEGFKAGYTKGWDDGHPTGYADAKVRVYAALAAVETTEAKQTIARIRDSIASTLGRPS